MARRILHLLAGMLVFLLACEGVLRLLPVSTFTDTGYHVDPLIINYPPHHAWTSSSGWLLQNAQHLHSNNAGFVAQHDFSPDPKAVALIGDSYVEASMLDAADRPDAQLERALDGRPVFALGGPGSALLDYAERIRWVHTRYAVRDIVVLMERGDVRQSLCGSGQIHGPCLDRDSLAPRNEIQPAAGALKRLARRSALAQYIFGQLKVDVTRLRQRVLAGSHGASPVVAGSASADHATARAADAAPAPRPDLDAVTAAFFERIRPYRDGRLVIVVDSDRTALTQPVPPVDADRDRFMAQARAHGAIVVDTEPLFRAHAKASPLKLDVGPNDSHLNRLGVGIAMQAAARALQAP